MRLVHLLTLAVIACGGGSKQKPTTPAASNKVLVLVDEQGVGVGGNDLIVYSTGTVEPGTDEFKSTHDGATYQFASTDNKATFDADPAKYAPAYGGYCAFAASQNRVSESDPTVFLNYEGQLLLFTNEDFREQFNKDAAGNKQAADKNWPGLVEQHGKPRG